MEFLLLIRKHPNTSTSEKEWNSFFKRASDSGMFKGGSEIGNKELIGNPTDCVQENFSGFMRFDSNNKELLLSLLKHHPIVLKGGSVDLYEMIQS